MDKRARLQATLQGDPVDRVAVALWRHFPVDDQDPALFHDDPLSCKVCAAGKGRAPS